MIHGLSGTGLTKGSHLQNLELRTLKSTWRMCALAAMLGPMGNIKAAPPTAISRIPLTGCTIAVSAEIPRAMVLAKSFLRFHPENEFVILTLDKGIESETLPPGTRVLSMSDLALETGDEWRLPMIYSEQQLVVLLMPALLQSVLNSGATAAAYFEVTTEVHSSLSDVSRAIHGHEPVIATEAVRSALGADLNPGFIAARRGAEKTLRSWFERLRNQNPAGEVRSTESDPARENWFHSIVSHRVITIPGFAVGFWNLKPETVAWNGEHYEVERKPLLSFDFRGYDPDKPHLLSKHQGLEPRILLSEWPVIAKLCDEYRDKVMEAGHSKFGRRAYPFDYLPSGLRIDQRMLRLYREAYRMYKQGSAKEPPSPFGPEGEEGFLNWLNEPVGKTSAMVTRYMLAVYDERKDVKKAFPDPRGADAGDFRDWYLRYGHRELDLPAVLLPFDARSEIETRGDASVLIPAAAVNVAGYFRAELGIGVAARALLTGLEAAGIPFNTIPFGATASRQSYPFVGRAAELRNADINIVCVNPDQFLNFAEQTGPALRHGRYTIGVWFWEVEDFPKQFHVAFDYVDEVWVGSEFMRETFLKVSPKSVFKFRLPVLTPQIDPSLSRADLGLPDKFVFLFSFDFLSVLERKNPVALIEAFTKAFSNGEGPVLVIKTINGDKRPLEMEKLRYASRGRPDIKLMDGYLSQIENNTFTALSDSYVSLHRSEGFGLTMAEAMALGKPTIATAYSGNLEFMTAENSYLCPFRRCKVGLEREPYPSESHWSCPDVDAAAGLMRRVFEDPAGAQKRGARAAEDVRSLHSPARAGQIMAERLAVIRRRRANSGPIRSTGFLQDRVEELEARLRGNAKTGDDVASTDS